MNKMFLPKAFDQDIDSPYCSEEQYGISATEIHWHSGMEIIYMQKGESRVFFDEKWHTLRQNSLLFIPIGKLHCCICSDDNAEKIVVGFTEKCFDNGFITNLLPLGIEKYCIFENLNNTQIPTLLHSLNSFYQQKSPSSYLRAKSCIYNVIAYMMDVWQDIGFKIDLTTKDNLQSEIMQYIQEHCVEDISPYTVAKHLNVSYSNLAKKIKNLQNVGFTKAVNHARIERAKKMLITTDKNVTEIAFDCGFFDVSYFIKTFRILTGTTPKQFKQLNIKNKGDY